MLCVDYISTWSCFKHSMAFCLEMGNSGICVVLFSPFPSNTLFTLGNYSPFRNVCNFFLPISSSFKADYAITTTKEGKREKKERKKRERKRKERKKKVWLQNKPSCFVRVVPWENGNAETGLNMIIYSWLVWIQMAFLVLVVYLNTNYLVFSVSYSLSDIWRRGTELSIVRNMFVNTRKLSVQIMFKGGSC